MSNSALPQRVVAKSPLKSSLIELAVVVILGACAGAAFEALRPGPSGSDKAAKSSAAASPAQPSAIVDLPPIVTNLGAPQDTWVRLEGSIIFEPRALPRPDVVAGRIGDDILAYLRTVSLRQLEGPIGLENIRQDLDDERRFAATGRCVHSSSEPWRCNETGSPGGRRLIAAIGRRRRRPPISTR